jgi:hypothetical protein
MISVVIGFSDRSVEVLRFVCQQWLEHGADRVIIANLGERRVRFAAPIYELHIPTVEWHEGHAKNTGALFAPPGIIVMTNADLIPRFDIRKDAETLERGKYLGPTKRNYRLTAEQTKQVMSGQEVTGDLFRHRGGNEHCAEGDYLMIHKADFCAARGYDPEDTGWGGCDTYFGRRLRAGGVQQTMSNGEVWHLWHKHPGYDSDRKIRYYEAKEKAGFWRGSETNGLVVRPSAESGSRCPRTVSVVIPCFNRDPEMLEYVVRDMLRQDIDEVVLANTGDKAIGFEHPNVVEVHNPLHKWLPGITRNMGAVVANGEVQVHAGADLVTASGSWSVFRDLDDNTSASASCLLLNQVQTKAAMSGIRTFPGSYNPGSRAVFGLTKRTAMMRLKGPFDWEMIGWGWVDVDLKHGVEKRLKMRHRQLTDLKVLHLWHGDGSSNWHKSARGPEFRKNRQKLDRKNRRGSRGWWSGLQPRKREKGEIVEEIIKKPDIVTGNSADQQLICGELDFYEIADAIGYLKHALDELTPGRQVYVTFNDMEKLGRHWAKSNRNRRNSAGRVRLTFWTKSMMWQALTDAGFVGIMETDAHIGRSVQGLTTLIGTKPVPKPKPTIPAERTEAMPAVSRPKRRTTTKRANKKGS